VRREKKRTMRHSMLKSLSGVINLDPVPNGTHSPHGLPPNPYFAAWAAG